MDDSEYYWDWLKYEDNLFTNRNNLLLVAESMTFAAVATIQAGTGKSAHGILLAAAGLFITLIWLFASLKHLVSTDPPLKRKLKEVDPRRNDFDLARSQWWSNHWLIGFILPFGLLIIWVIWLCNIIN
jgi:hypothetical protein